MKKKQKMMVGTLSVLVLVLFSTANIAGARQNADSGKTVKDAYNLNDDTLKLGIDKDGITPIVVRNDVVFADRARLYVGFIDDSKRIGSWDVMTWEGELKNDGLKFADSVDKDTWTFEFIDTEGDGSPDTLRVSAIPDRFKRIVSVKKLTGRAPDKAINCLVQVLKADNLKDRLAAIETLKQMGKAAAPALSASGAKPAIEVMLNMRGLQEKAVEAGLAAGVVDLEALALNHENTRVRKIAARRYKKEQKPFSLPKGSAVLDRIVFGSKASEKAHDFSPDSSRIIKGKDGHFARQITIPYKEAGFDVHRRGFYEDPGFNDEGHSKVVGSCSFTIDCDPDAQNYITLKFQQETPESWGRSPFLSLWHGDQQIGWVKQNADWAGGAYNRRVTGEWAHFTYPLPKSLTEGKESIDLHLGTFDSKWNLIGSGPVVYRAYSHTDALFELPGDEERIDNRDFGESWGPDRDGDIDTAIDIIQRGIEDAVQSAQRGNLGNQKFKAVRDLAYARQYDWINSYDLDAAFDVIRSYIDSKVIKNAKQTDGLYMFPNAHNWGAHGALARAFVEMSDVFEKRGLLEEPIEGHPEDIPRAEAYADFWAAAWQWRDSRHAGKITNQVQFVNEGLIAMADALEILAPDRAPPQERVDLWIDEMIGLAPVAPSWHIHSEAGLNEEPGYSIGHGMLPFFMLERLATDTGSDRVKERLKDFNEAMGWFRWRGKHTSAHNGKYWDAGVWKDRRCMIQAGRLSSRGGARWPGYDRAWMGYGRAPAALAALGSDAADAEAVKRRAELLVEDGPIMRWVAGAPDRLSQVLQMVEGLRMLKEMEPSTYKLPWERDRAVWGDPDQAMVSIVDGDARLQAKLGHGRRSQYQTNYVAFDYKDTHTARPGGTVLRRNEFPEAGTTEMGGGFFSKLHRGLSNEAYVAWAGEWRPVSQYFQGVERPYAGRDGVRYQYNSHRRRLYSYREADIGPYRIGINPTGGEVVERRVWDPKTGDATETETQTVGEHRGFGPGQTFEMDVPDGGAVDLATGKKFRGGTVTVGPRETRVLKALSP